jgi:hypothetical protein
VWVGGGGDFVRMSQRSGAPGLMSNGKITEFY